MRSSFLGDEIEMEENAAALHTAISAVHALGRGFDVNFDTRLLYCKGVSGATVVEIDEGNTRDLCLYDNLVVPSVSRDIKTFSEPAARHASGVCTYDEVTTTTTTTPTAHQSSCFSIFQFLLPFAAPIEESSTVVVLVLYFR